MLDKAQLGTRYSCYECGTKFYDLNRPAALCPECNADQANAPVRDIRSLLSGGGRKIPKMEDDEKLVVQDDDDDADASPDDGLLDAVDAEEDEEDE